MAVGARLAVGRLVAGRLRHGYRVVVLPVARLGLEDHVAGGPGSNYQLLAWSFGLVDDRGNMTASGPAFVNAGTAEAITVDWTGLLSNTIYLGGVSHNTPQGISAITIIRIGN